MSPGATWDHSVLSYFLLPGRQDQASPCYNLEQHHMGMRHWAAVFFLNEMLVTQFPEESSKKFTSDTIGKVENIFT